jgi:MFS transporter, UMF1 family
MQKDNPKVINAWCLYDWANSVYALIISSTLFPIYYNSITRKTFQGEDVVFMGNKISNTVLYSYSISVGYLILVIVIPLLSGIADYSGKKKWFMQFFTWVGGLACCTLFFFKGDNIHTGIVAATLGVVGYAGGLVFYNSFLPDIATPAKQNYASAKGYAWGYIGGVVLLLLIIPATIFPQKMGFQDDGEAVRYGFMLTGIWWIGFAQVTFYYLPNPNTATEVKNIISKGYQEIFKVFQMLRQMPTMKWYLLAFFFYIMGVQTIMYLAAIFGEKEVKLSSEQLITTVLLIQLLAVVGAYFFAWLAERQSNQFSLLTMLLVWIGVCLGAYFIKNATHFYIAAIVIGLIMGGIQSLSRATFSKLIPNHSQDTTSFFSFFDITEKVAIVSGTFVFGLVEQLTGSMRNSTLALAIFFVLGFIFLFFNKLKQD